MKVYELITKIIDSYIDIVIHECEGLERTGTKYVIPKHAIDCTHVPKEIWESEISMIIPYYDRISIDVEVK